MVHRPGPLNGGEPLFRRGSFWQLVKDGYKVSGEVIDQFYAKGCKDLYGVEPDERFASPTPQAEPEDPCSSTAGWQEKGRALDGRLRPVTPYMMTLTASQPFSSGGFEPVVCTNYPRESVRFSALSGREDWPLVESLRATTARSSRNRSWRRCSARRRTSAKSWS